TIGRSARHINAEVILYADRMTNSMQNAIDETERRRAIQEEYNREHGITPESIKKAIKRGIEGEMEAQQFVRESVGFSDESEYITQEFLSELEKEMLEAAEKLEFERAALLRDRIDDLKNQGKSGQSQVQKSSRAGKKGKRQRRKR
ncbi:MAG: UvrB/UvrC motif-containing protein, partial [Planctomycetota bacterium]